jgi:hypothetical protein
VLQEDTNGDYVQYQNETYDLMDPHPDIMATTYRVFYDKNGNEISREKLREDHYLEIEGVTLYGKLPPPAPTPGPEGTSSP